MSRLRETFFCHARPKDVDGAAEDPVEGVNLAYTIHFYANTHKQAVGSYLEGLKLPCQVKRIQF